MTRGRRGSGPALLTSLCNRGAGGEEDVLTACFLGIISRVTQLAPKTGGGAKEGEEEEGGEAGKQNHGAERWLKVGGA